MNMDHQTIVKNVGYGVYATLPGKVSLIDSWVWSNARFDLYQMNAEIESFCEKHFLGYQQRHDILLILEETLMRCFNGDHMDCRGKAIETWGGIDLVLSYSEKNATIEIQLSTGAGAASFLQSTGQEDDLSLLIIQGLTENIEERTEDGKLYLNMILRNGKNNQ